MRIVKFEIAFFTWIFCLYGCHDAKSENGERKRLTSVFVDTSSIRDTFIQLPDQVSPLYFHAIDIFNISENVVIIPNWNGVMLVGHRQCYYRDYPEPFNEFLEPWPDHTSDTLKPGEMITAAYSGRGGITNDCILDFKVVLPEFEDSTETFTIRQIGI